MSSTDTRPGTAEMTIPWESIRCRFGCDSPVVGVYFFPDGCICWPDKLQALCSHHMIKGMQNNMMTLVFVRGDR